MKFVTSFKIGQVVSNNDIVSEFKVGNMGGMRRSLTTGTLVIIADHTKALYDDKYYNQEIHYTGMGKYGDQVLKSQNKTLAESNTNGVEVHLFEVFEPKKYTYQGIVKLVGEPYQEIQKDENKVPRKVWIFPLKKIQYTEEK